MGTDLGRVLHAAYKEMYQTYAWLLVGSFVFIVAFLLLAIIPSQSQAVIDMHALEISVETWQIFAVLGILVFGISLIMRWIKMSMAIDAIMSILIFLGVWFGLWLIAPMEIALLISATLTVIQARWRIVIVHDVFTLIGIAGLALYMALALSTTAILCFLVAFGFYDMFGKRYRGEITKFAMRYTHRGMVPGIIVPKKADQWQKKFDSVWESIGLRFVPVLDIMLPSALIAQAMFLNGYFGCIVAAGICIGAWIAGKRGERHERSIIIPTMIGGLIPYLLIISFVS